MRYFSAPVVAVLVVAALILGVLVGGEIGRRAPPVPSGAPVATGELVLPETVRVQLAATGFESYVRGQIQAINWYVGLYDTGRDVSVDGVARYGPDGQRVADIAFGDAIGSGEAGVNDVCLRLVHEAAHHRYAAFGNFYSNDGERYARAIEAKFLAAVAAHENGGSRTVPNTFGVAVEPNP